MTYEVGTLKEIGAQVGDVVEHEDGSHYEIRINDRGVPANWCISGMRWGVEVSESTQDYRIISSANQCPVREVTRKEIVPGVYGPLTIRATDELGPVQLEINGTTGRTWFNKSDVESLVNTLTQIRDAMADSSAT